MAVAFDALTADIEAAEKSRARCRSTRRQHRPRAACELAL